MPEQAPPHPVPVPVAMERAHAEMSSAATVGLLLGHDASVTASTNGCAAEQVGKTTPQAPAGKNDKSKYALDYYPPPQPPPLAGCVR